MTATSANAGKPVRISKADEELTMSQTQTLSRALTESVLSFVKSDLPADEQIANIQKSFEQYGAKLDLIFEPVTKVEKATGALSFQESVAALAAQRAVTQAMAPVYDCVAGLQDSIISVVSDPTIQDKAAAIQDTVSQFDQAIDAAIQMLTGANPDGGEEMGEGEEDPNDPNAQQDPNAGAPAKVDAPEQQSQEVAQANAQEQQAQPQPPAQQPAQQQAQPATGQEEDKRKPFGKSDDGEPESFAKAFTPDIEVIYAELKKGAESTSEGDYVQVEKGFLADVAVVLDVLYGEAITKADVMKARKAKLAAMRAHADMFNQHLDELEKDGDMGGADEEGLGEDVNEGDAMIGKAAPGPTAEEAAAAQAQAMQEAIAKALAPVQAQLATVAAEKDATIATLSKRLEKIESQPKGGGAILVPAAASIAIAKGANGEPAFIPRDTDTGTPDVLDLMKSAYEEPVFKPQTD